LIIPHAPTPTLFPYTTLFRSLDRNGADFWRFLPGKPQEVIDPVREPVHFLDHVLRHLALGGLGLVIVQHELGRAADHAERVQGRDRKSTRLNSSHVAISYAVF